MKQAIVAVAALMVLVAHSQVQAQEREPLAMRIELEWTIAGTALGALVGAALWLTDPGNPHNVLSVSVLEGASLGALAGAGFGIYIMQQRIQVPGGTAGLEPTPGEPAIAAARPPDALASFHAPVQRGFAIPLAQFKLRF